MPIQVWDKKPKVNVLDIHVTCKIWHKLIVFHTNAKIKSEVAEEGNRLTLYLTPLFFGLTYNALAWIYDKYSLSRRAKITYSKGIYCKEEGYCLNISKYLKAI
jgi:hypothetical protein